jgi:hypothetical protein
LPLKVIPEPPGAGTGNTAEARQEFPRHHWQPLEAVLRDREASEPGSRPAILRDEAMALQGRGGRPRPPRRDRSARGARDKDSPFLEARPCTGARRSGRTRLPRRRTHSPPGRGARALPGSSPPSSHRKPANRRELPWPGREDRMRPRPPPRAPRFSSRNARCVTGSLQGPCHSAGSGARGRARSSCPPGGILLRRAPRSAAARRCRSPRRSSCSSPRRRASG